MKKKPKNNGIYFPLFQNNLKLKLTTLLLLVAMFTIRANTYSQTKVNLDLNNMTVETVLETIEQKTDFRFIYKINDIDLDRIISIHAKNEPIDAVLHKLFKGTATDFKIKDTQIILKKPVLEVKETHILIKQTTKGRVSDEKGNPLPGVNIVKKGTKIGVTTDAAGIFSIDVNEGDVLVFKLIGFEDQERKVTNDTMEVVLKLEITKMDDVVVVGYGKQKSAKVVSAISTIKGEKLQVTGRSLTNSLAGRVAGLYAIQRSGEPGNDNAEIYIRGLSSFAGGTGALILVDGVPRNMADISPEEIETFTVLKDASATAVYGSEGANGVILITSKRGLQQKTAIEFRADNYYNSPTRVMPFLGSGDWLRLYNEAKWNTEGNPNKTLFVPYKTDAQIALYDSGVDLDLYPNVNWMDMLKKVAINQKYSLNFRGGGDKMRFFVGTSYYSEEGAFKSNPIDYNEYNKNINYDVNIGVKRYNLRSNIDIDISETTKLSIDLSGQYLTTNYPGTGTSTIFTAMMRSAPHLIPMIYSNGYPSRYNAGASLSNPYTLLNFKGYTKEFRVALQTNIGIEQKFKTIPGLIWKLRTSFDSDFMSKVAKIRTPSEYYSNSRDLDGNLIMTKVINGQNTATDETGGGYSGGNKRIYMETSIAYNKKLGSDHEVSGLLLLNQKESQLQDQPYPYKKQGAVGRLSYAYGNKYFMDASFGFTGSENFAPNNRFGLFPAFGLGYLVTNEYKIGDLIKSMGIETLKLRLSYGRGGNDKVLNSQGIIARFPYKEGLNWSSSTLNLGMNSAGGTNSSTNLIFERQAYSPNVRWEVEEKRNIGIDITTWKRGLNFSIDYFDNLRHDILLQRTTVSQVAGLQQNPFENFGKVSNKGIDASLNIDKTFGDFQIGATGTFTFARNKILEMDEVPRAEWYQNSTGTRLNTVDGWVAERLYANDDFDIVANPTTGAKTYTLKAGLPISMLGNVYPGNIKYVDLNNDGKIDDFDWTKHVDGAFPSTPEIIYGFGLNVGYGGFYASAFFQGVANVTAYLDPAFMIPFTGADPLATSTKGFALDRWSEENPNPNALLPRLQLNNTNQSDNRRSSWFLRDAGFLRFKNAEIGYKIKKKQLDHLGLTSVRVYLLGTNLAVWDHIKYWDPEQGGSAGGSGYPIQRTLNVGLDVAF
jgi:TonB-linked SusC/RagA family outer membrane protein